MLIHSYRSAFILLITAVLVITVGAVAYNAYRRAAQVSLDLSAEIIAGLSRTTMERTAGVFETVRGYLEIDAIAAEQGDIVARQEELLRLFRKQIELTPQIISLYVADANGSFVQAREQPQRSTRVIDRRSEPAREHITYADKASRLIARLDGGGLYDPRARPWYQAGTGDGDVRISALYRFDSTGTPGITTTKAVADASGETALVLGADITLESLSEFLAEQSIARGVVAMIVDEEGRLVAFPYQLRLRGDRAQTAPDELPEVGDLTDTWIADAYQALRSGAVERTRTGNAAYTVSESRGVDYLAHLEDLPVGQGVDWKLLVVVPQRTLLAGANRLLSESLAISLVILAAAVLIVYATASRFFEPARRLAHNAALIRSFRLDEVQPLRSPFREVQMVDEAIYGLKQGLQALGRFLPPDVVRQLIWSEQEPASATEMRDIALLFVGFSDVRRPGAELSAEQAGDTVTRRLERYTRLVVEEEGTVDRYLSDTLMAFWAAPVEADEGVERACRLALRCRSTGAAPVDEAMPDSTFAVHAGPAVVGGAGAVHRLGHTAIGDQVELAYRLRQLNRHYGIPILVSESAQRRVAELFWWRRLDVVPIDEGGGELTLYELVDERGKTLAPALRDYVERYEAALSALRAQRWEEAQAAFEPLARARPRDLAVRIMLQRCRTQDARGCPWTEPAVAAQDEPEAPSPRQAGSVT